MSTIARVFALCAAMLLLTAAAIFFGKDRQVLVAPPEQVAEQFAKKWVRGRYGLARSHLEENLRAGVPETALRPAAHESKRRLGPIDEVRGEPGPTTADSAKATVWLRTRDGRETPASVGLVFRRGAWRIERLDPLFTGTTGAAGATARASSGRER